MVSTESQVAESFTNLELSAIVGRTGKNDLIAVNSTKVSAASRVLVRSAPGMATSTHTHHLNFMFKSRIYCATSFSVVRASSLRTLFLKSLLGLLATVPSATGTSHLLGTALATEPSERGPPADPHQRGPPADSPSSTSRRCTCSKLDSYKFPHHREHRGSHRVTGDSEAEAYAPTDFQTTHMLQNPPRFHINGNTEGAGSGRAVPPQPISRSFSITKPATASCVPRIFKPDGSQTSSVQDSIGSCLSANLLAAPAAIQSPQPELADKPGPSNTDQIRLERRDTAW
ncbi:hypothetical protein B0T19DRAFT_476419 [Cercophora scortea]|uniref:Uncharacterized protein n=1 Tax=Cercophora scortea TaxID=314031 RepID=A0AAE0M9B5_9PEZI|nr:hypothetical protein B0T19DRAFT_476419 [Cercophora scortea]